MTTGGVEPDAAVVRLVAGGDVQWAQRYRPPVPEFLPRAVPAPQWAGRLPRAWRERHRVARLINAVHYRLGGRRLPDLPVVAPSLGEAGVPAHPVDLSGVETARRQSYPFERIGELLRAGDLTFVNLENPLSDEAPLVGRFVGAPAFARALAEAGVDVVSLANNHTGDGGETGFRETLAALAAAGVASVGAGVDLDAARRPVVLERGGRRFAFLAYTRHVNIASSFALAHRPGAAPLDPDLVVADIRRAAARADVVVVSLHWGIEEVATVHWHERELARAFVAAGARLVLGHGPHVPRAVEVVDGAVVAYSLGNFVFAHGHPPGPYGPITDGNMLLDVRFRGDQIETVKLRPVAGRMTEVGRPYPLAGDRARALLESWRAAGARWGTTVEIRGDHGVVVPNAAAAPGSR